MQGINISKLIPWKSLVALIIAVAATIWLIYALGAGSIGRAYVSTLSVLPTVLLISFFYFFLQTFAWQLTLRSKEGSFWGLFTIEMGAYALGRLAPFLLIGGEPIQSDLLRKKFGISSAAESIATDRAMQTLGTGIFVITGLIVGFLNTPTLPLAVRIGIPILALLFAIFCVVAIRSENSGFFGALLSKAQKLGIPGLKSAAVTGSLDEADRALLQFYRERRGAFYQSLFLQLLCLGLLVAEVYIIGSALLTGFSPSWALLLGAVTPLVAALFCIIPGGLAVVEGAVAGLLALALGAPAAIAGLALVLIRRTRALCWIVAGMILVRNPFRIFLK